VQLVNARQVKNVPGRPKTDKLDAVWLAELTERGMLRPSLVPPAEIRQLRDYTRLRVDLTQERARHWQRLEKLLEDALIKVSRVASKLDTLSVRAMVEALIAGERDPKVLAGLAKGRMRSKHAALVEALTGQFDDHHAELARMLLDQIDALGAQITTFTTRIEQLLAAIPAAQGVDADGATGPGAGTGPGAAVLPAVARLDAVTGIGRDAAQVLLAELGLDMGVFPSPAHLVSWAKLCPRTIQPAPSLAPARPARATPTSKASSARPPPQPPRPTPSSGSATGASSSAAANSRPWSLSPAPSWSSLAPAGRPRRPLCRPGRRLLRQPHRQRQEGPQPCPSTGSPRVHRHPRPGSLTPPRTTTSRSTSRLRRLLPPARFRSIIFRSGRQAATAKWRCPTGECSPASKWIAATRLHTLIPRGTARWKQLYRQRGSVERENGRLKHEWGLLPLRLRRIERVRLHADLTILARLACVLASARAAPLAA
jgi:transposase